MALSLPGKILGPQVSQTLELGIEYDPDLLWMQDLLKKPRRPLTLKVFIHRWH
jgi:hypothetical protein